MTKAAKVEYDRQYRALNHDKLLARPKQYTSSSEFKERKRKYDRERCLRLLDRIRAQDRARTKLRQITNKLPVNHCFAMSHVKRRQAIPQRLSVEQKPKCGHFMPGAFLGTR